MGAVRLIVVCWVIVLTIVVSSCTSGAKAKTRERAAYAAGQQQAMERVAQMRSTVTVVGPVRNPILPWSGDLTLARAIVAADYYPRGEPREIVVMRNGQPIPFEPKRLLAGEDLPLEVGDVINIR